MMVKLRRTWILTSILYLVLLFDIAELQDIKFPKSKDEKAEKGIKASKPAAAKVCVTVSGASPNLPCIFPFRFNGVTHNKCTWDQAHLTEHKAWCSTLVDGTGHHVGGQGKWGNCGAGCPIPTDDRNKGKGILAPGKT